ncbi:Head-to-tail connector protein, podovirus-type [uncultured Caudovirales phage]|uniref:Head-to-tail connector protein, podovirus-type n=1 Tax=uncultured Caudovirales phage TaxID=2100421 RepID=A0A6J5SEU4_9CAUD|nr:Head-to-tail connector protein, podovirus-type [uncultured Caudovirales phage]CAB5227941.1 Head-to-tail connector protein, podovirus-type [uncultured Caudovirales phage]
MQDNDPKAVSVIQRFESQKSERATWETNWQDIRDMVRPTTTDFNHRSSPGQSRVDQVYDGTAREASKELSAALHSYMSSPTERWFEIQATPDVELQRDPRVISWSEQVADAIYGQYCNDRTGLTSALHEAYLDIAAFGNCIVYQDWDGDSAALHFRTHPLSACFFEEDYYGRISSISRNLPMTCDQVNGQFGPVLGEEHSRDKVRKWDVIHAVYSREQRDYGKQDNLNMPYASCWVLKDKKLVLRESGYAEFPYHVGRWNKIAGEQYGRGPADDCLPDIRMLNRMEYTMIKAAKKAVEPPLQLTSDGFIIPSDGISTGANDILYREPGTEPAQYLEFKGNIPWGEEKVQQKRDFIRQCFYADWVKLMPKKERQTAYEISELVEQQLRMMAPMLGRLQTELLGPMIVRSYNLLREHNRLPAPPAQLQGATLRIAYMSAAARAQVGSKATLIGRYIQELVPLAQISPTVMDAVDADQVAQELANLRGVSRRVLRTSDQIDEIRNARQQNEQMQQMAAVAEPASKALLNVAQAQKAGGV